MYDLKQFKKMGSFIGRSTIFSIQKHYWKLLAKVSQIIEGTNKPFATNSAGFQFVSCTYIEIIRSNVKKYQIIKRKTLKPSEVHPVSHV